MSWNKEELRAEVESYEDGKFVNWSALAKAYNVKNTQGNPAANGGQIVKEWLKSVGVDTERFKRYNTSDGPRVRLKKRKGLGGEISTPTPETNSALKKRLQEKILQNEYSVGKLIVPKKVYCQYVYCFRLPWFNQILNHMLHSIYFSAYNQKKLMQYVLPSH